MNSKWTLASASKLERSIMKTKDRYALLVAIESEYSGKIYIGEKDLEVRTRPFPFLESRKLVFADTKTGGVISGMADYVAVYRDLSSQLFLDRSCLTLEELNKYQGGRPFFFHYLQNPFKFPVSVKLSDIGITSMPQSWRYLTREQYETIISRGNNKPN